eukprot:TRINITY_DN2546_c0_g1_i1.p4 TRINITY_DN2546_c0_g1~~TRINITY_DN2546_c0_g1_i1.p4  ORF type:complete len:144 (-),score=30.68 TRINITY_DN2546_c0_g1_i1:355-786(-)
MIRRPPRSTHCISSAASDVYKRQYQRRVHGVDLGIENLFDRLYSLPLGGAYTGQGTTMSTTGTYSPAWGIVVPGMGRSIYAGLNVKFQAIDPGKPRPRPGLYHFWTREKHGSDVCHFIPEPTGYTNWCADLLGPRSGKCLAPE